MVLFDTNQPIYLQIMADVKKLLASGELPPGSRVPPVRDLAAEYGVNPNTMQRALSELDRAGYLTVGRTTGRCVTTDTEMLERLRMEELYMAMTYFVTIMEKLGIRKDEMVPVLSTFLKNQQKN